MNRNGNQTPLADRRNHVIRLDGLLKDQPDLPLRTACRMIDPAEPDALRSAYRRQAASDWADRELTAGAEHFLRLGFAFEWSRVPRQFKKELIDQFFNAMGPDDVRYAILALRRKTADR